MRFENFSVKNLPSSKLCYFVFMFGFLSAIVNGLSVHASSLAKGTIAVDAYDNIAVTADSAGLVQMYDLTNPASPIALSRLNAPMELSSVAISGNYALLSGKSGVQILDISQPKSPVFRDMVSLESEATTVIAAGNLGYAAVESTVVLFNISTGAILDRRAYSSLPVRDLSISGDYLYVLSAAEGDSKFQLTKVSIGGSLGSAVASFGPLKTAGADQPGAGSLSLYAADNLIYIGSVSTTEPKEGRGVEVLEDHGSSFIVKGLPQPIDAEVIRPTGVGLLAYAGQAKQLGVLDVTDASNAGKVLQLFDTSAPIHAITLYHGYAYLASGVPGLRVVDFVKPNGLKAMPIIALGTNVVAEAPADGKLVRMTAQVAAADQIRKVDFYVDGKKVASDGNYPFEYRFATAEVDPATTAYACAEDVNGNSSCTDPAPLQSKAKKALKVTSVTPSEGSNPARSSKLVVTAAFSLPLDPATVLPTNVTITKVSKTSAPSTVIAVSGVSYQASSKSLAIQTKSPLTAGTYKVTLSAAIKSSTQATMASDYSWTFAVTGVTVTWANLESGNWGTASNWSGGLVPADGDSVVISTAGVKVSLTSGTPEINNLTVGSGSTLLIAGGNLAVDGSGSVAGTLDISSGEWGGPASASVATLNLSGGVLANGSPMTVTGKSNNWTGGGVTGVLNIPATAALNIAVAFDTTFYLSGGTINNSGTVTQSFAGTPGSYIGLQVSNGGVINNLAGGVWNVVSDVWVYPTDTTINVFNNTGTFNKIGGTNTSLWSLSFGGSGPINVNLGTLSLSGTYARAITAPIAIATNAILNYGQGGTFAGSKVTGSGTLNFTASVAVTGAYSFTGLTQIQSGTTSFSNPTTIATLNLLGGALGGAGPVTVTGAMHWTGGGITGVLDIPATAALTIAMPFDSTFYLSGGTINNSGTVTQSFAGTPGSYVGVQVSKSSVINNLAGGVWNVVSDVWVYPTDTTINVFNNSGTFNKTGGSNTSLWTLSLGGSGPINVNLGTLTLGGTYTRAITGPIAIAANAILNYGQGGTFDGSKVTGSGTLNFTASAAVTGAYSFTGLTQIQSGTTTFNNPTTIATLNLVGGALGGAGPVTVTGAMHWTGGGITGVLDIPATAALTIAMPFDTSFYLSGATINNSGTVTQSFAGTPGSYVGVQVSKSSVINNLAGGVWNVVSDVWIYPTDTTSNVFNNSGTFNKTGGSNTSLWTLSMGGSGPINVNLGTLTLNGIYTRTLMGPIAVATNAILNYGQGGTFDGTKVTGSGTLNFTASAAVTGNYSFTGLTQIQSGTTSFNNPTTIATLNLLGGALGGAGPVTVTGAMHWTGGGITGVLDIPAKAALTIAMPFDTSFYLSGGTINNSGTVTQSFAGTPGSYVGLQVSNSSVINNLAGGIWDVISDVWIYPTDSTGNVFNNSGTFNKTGGSNTSIWSLAFNNTGTVNLTSGTVTLNGYFPTSQISGAMNIASPAILNYAQQGTLTSGTAAGNGTFNITTSTGANGTTGVLGSYKITVPANLLGGTLEVKASATLNLTSLNVNGTGLTIDSLGNLIAGSISLTGANFSVSGTTSIGNLNVSATSGGNSQGSNVSGPGTINVSDTLNWSGGSVNVTGAFNIQNMSLASNSALTFKLGSGPLSVNAKLDLNGTLTVTYAGSNPAVGTAFKVINLANNYLGNFADVVIPLIGGNDHLNESLIPGGLSFVVATGPS